MDIRKIKKLIDLIEQTGIGEIEIKEGEQSVRISKGAPQAQHVAYQTPPASAIHPNTFEKAFSAKNNDSDDLEDDTDDPDLFDGHEICSPIVGTVYLSAEPGKKAFVSVGQMVNVGDTLCIVEAMKVFNEIECDKAGKVKAVLVENEQPLEYGQVLFIIE